MESLSGATAEVCPDTGPEPVVIPEMSDPVCQDTAKLFPSAPSAPHPQLSPRRAHHSIPIEYGPASLKSSYRKLRRTTLPHICILVAPELPIKPKNFSPRYGLPTLYEWRVKPTGSGNIRRIIERCIATRFTGHPWEGDNLPFR